MPFCNTALFITNLEDVESMLSSFAKENFIQGQAAYALGNNRFAVDAGENDLRAIFDEDNQIVKFFCRYQQDKARYEKKILSFAEKHNIETTELKTD